MKGILHSAVVITSILGKPYNMLLHRLSISTRCHSSLGENVYKSWAIMQSFIVFIFIVHTQCSCSYVGRLLAMLLWLQCFLMPIRQLLCPPPKRSELQMLFYTKIVTNETPFYKLIHELTVCICLLVLQAPPVISISSLFSLFDAFFHLCWPLSQEITSQGMFSTGRIFLEMLT